jgi:LPS-assembly protein
LSYESEGAVLKAEGHVHLEWNSTELSADLIRVERAKRHLMAEGRLVFESPDVVLHASSCDLDLDTETGTLKNVVVTRKDGAGLFGGAVVAKELGRRYRIEDGYYTTCASRGGRSPDWELAGDKVDVELDGFGRLTGGTFRVRGVPILYIPYAIFPTRLTRQTGLLLPEVGLSNRRGFVYRQPLYWAIDKHSDATLTAHLESNLRAGAGLEYRYRPARDIEGEVTLEYFREAFRNSVNGTFNLDIDPNRNVDVDKNRGLLRTRHRQIVGDDVLFYADGLVVSDDVYFREIDASVGEGVFASTLQRSQRYTESRMGLFRAKNFTSYGAEAAAYQDFFDQKRQTLQKPLQVWGVTDGSFAGLAYSMESSFVSYARRHGADGQRVDVVGTLERPVLSGAPIRSNVWLRGRTTGYLNDDRDVYDKEGAFVERLDRWAARGVVEAGVDARTGLSRSYALDATHWSSLEHTIEPFTALRFTSESSHADIPLYDNIDRIDGRTTGTYGIGSRFLFTDRETGKRTELARASLAQTYNFDDVVINNHFSDVDLTFTLQPASGVSISGIASYNIGEAALSGATTALSVEQFALPYTETPKSRIDAVYRFVQGEVVQTPDGLQAVEGLQTLEGRGILAMTDQLSLGINGRFDFESHQFVESGGGLRIEAACGCWAIDMGVVDRVNPNELQVRVQLELSGLGALGSSPLSFHTAGLAGFTAGVAGITRRGW